jgi:hypothetical protein
MSAADHERAVPRSAPSLDALLHPLPLAALALLLLNDHVLKASHPGWLSGKLSDVAGLILLPFMLLAGWDLVHLVRPGLPAAGPRGALLFTVSVMVAFAAVEIVPVGAELYQVGLGGAQWPFRALAALVATGPVPGLAPVQLTSDLSDLLTLPAALVVLAVRPWRGSSTDRVDRPRNAGEAARTGRTASRSAVRNGPPT